MALFNKINRRIKSMQEGGQPFSGGVVMPEVDDGSIGGFNRPELRGLRKQARRGTLTNRERRRLNYLTNEVKGRRRRGLLSGLGGAAAALGTAALIKGGGAKGLMDSIKGKIGSIKSDLGALPAKRQFKKMIEEEQRERFGIGEKKDDPPINIDDIDVWDVEGQLYPDQTGAFPDSIEEEEFPDEPTGEQLGEEAAAMRQLMADRDLEESDRELDEMQAEEAGLPGDVDEETVGKQSFGKGQVYSTKDMLNALQNAKTPEEEQAILDKMGVTGSTPNPKAIDRLEEEMEYELDPKRGYEKVLLDPNNPYGGTTKKRIMRGSKGPLNPDDFAPQQGPEVDLPSDTEQLLQGLSQGIDPAVLGAVRGGGGESLISKIDPEGLVQEGGEEGALRILQALNVFRKQQGLPPVDKLTKEAIKEGNMAAAPKRLSPLQAGPIESNVEDPFGGTLPQLRAQQLLRGSKMNAGGMVKRMMKRYN